MVKKEKHNCNSATSLSCTVLTANPDRDIHFSIYSDTVGGNVSQVGWSLGSSLGPVWNMSTNTAEIEILHANMVNIYKPLCHCELADINDELKALLCPSTNSQSTGWFSTDSSFALVLPLICFLLLSLQQLWFQCSSLPKWIMPKEETRRKSPIQLNNAGFTVLWVSSFKDHEVLAFVDQCPCYVLTSAAMQHRELKVQSEWGNNPWWCHQGYPCLAFVEGYKILCFQLELWRCAHSPDRESRTKRRYCLHYRKNEECSVFRAWPILWKCHISASAELTSNLFYQSFMIPSALWRHNTKRLYIVSLPKLELWCIYINLLLVVILVRVKEMEREPHSCYSQVFIRIWRLLVQSQFTVNNYRSKHLYGWTYTWPRERLIGSCMTLLQLQQ